MTTLIVCVIIAAASAVRSGFAVFREDETNVI